MRKMKVSEIKIKKSFEETTPHEAKINECREWYLQNGTQDRVIVVDHFGELIDGYVQYLVLKELGIEEAEVKFSDRKKKRWYRKRVGKHAIPCYKNMPTTYIHGIHKNGKKEYTWRVPSCKTESIYSEVLPGDTILVATKNGTRAAIVTKIETLDKCPVDFKVRKYLKKLGE